MQSEADTIGENPSVPAVFEDRRRELHTTRSPQFLNLRNQRDLWSNSDYSSDVIIGLLDTEIRLKQRSFFDRNLKACWWMLGSTGYVGWDCRVCCCCWSDRWSFLDIWGLGFVGNFAFWNFFLFFKLLTCCGIWNFFDYGLVWESMSWVPCWVSILWMVWFRCDFMWVFLCLLLLMLFDLVMFMFFFFSCWFDVHALWF